MSAFFDTFAVAAFDRFARFPTPDREVLVANGQERAGDETDKVTGIWGGPRFIEIFDAPDKAAFNIAPSPEVLDVQITNDEGLWRAGKFGTNDRPKLRPSVPCIIGANGTDSKLYSIASRNTDQ